MFRLISIFLIIITSSLCGAYKYILYKERRELLLDFKDMVLHLEMEMNYFKEPLPYIFKRISENKSTKSYMLLQNIINKNGQESFYLTDAWNESIDEIYETSNITNEDIKILKKIGDFVGQSDLIGQKCHFDVLKTDIDEKLQEATFDLRTKGKMYAKMGISIGAIVAIVIS